MQLREAPRSKGILTILENSKLNKLKKVREKLGSFLHGVLIAHHKEDPQKIFLDSALAPGLAADALASNDGSSKYLIGGMVNYSNIPASLPSALQQNEREFVGDELKRIWNFCREARTEDVTIIAGSHGYTSGNQAGRLLVYAANRQGKVLSKVIECEADEMPGTLEYRQAVQQISAIATLDEISSLLQVPLNQNLLNQLEDLNEKDLSSPDIIEVESKNKEAWNPLFRLFREVLNGQKLSLGESFTAGILAEITASLPGASEIFDLHLNWYDPRLKTFVGVPERNIQDNLIAEPETISLATQGLLRKSSPLTTVAIGTTGWANYWVPGQADYFSIGLAANQDGKLVQELARVEVTHSAQLPRSPQRGQLTRHLGASTSLLLLTNYLLIKAAPNHVHELEQTRLKLLQLIQKYGQIGLLK